MDFSSLPASRASSPQASTRRIALQAPADLTHLRALALRAARQKIDVTLPFEAAFRDELTGVTKDELRSRVEADVAAYIDRTFDFVRQGVEINGIVPGPGWEGEEEVEGYDKDLAARVQGMYTRVAELNLEVAERRRGAAVKAKGDFQIAWKDLREEDEKYQETVQRSAEAVDAEGLLGSEGIMWQERSESVKANWNDGLNELKSINANIGKAEGRGRQAERVTNFLDAKAT